jgi:hypothetical protein
MAAKRGFASSLVRIEIPPSLAQATGEYRSSWVLRAISAASREGGACVFAAEEALFEKEERLEGMADRYWGIAYFRLRGPDPPRMARAAIAAGFLPVDALPACERIEVSFEVLAAYARDAEDALKSWLSDARISFVEERSGGSRLLKPSARDVRKKILFEASLTRPESSSLGKFAAILTLGPKAKVEELRLRMGQTAARSASIRFLRY